MRVALVIAFASLFLLSVACKKPAPPMFDGTCAVSRLEVEPGNKLGVKVAFEPKPGSPDRPEGTLDVIVMRVAAPGTPEAPGSPAHCSMHASVEPASYHAPRVADFSLAIPGDCADPLPAGHYVKVFANFTRPWLTGNTLMGCAFDGRCRRRSAAAT